MRGKMHVIAKGPATFSSPAAPHPFGVVVRFDHAEGVAALEGRDVIARFGALELERMLGAIPASRFKDTEDFRAMIRVIRWLKAEQQGRD